MSSLPPSAVMGLHRFDTDDAFLNTEVNENTDDLDTLPPTVCTSGTRPATNLYQGRLIWESDTKRLMMYDLATLTWRMISDNTDGIWVDFSSTIRAWTATSTTPVEVTNKSVGLAKYKLIGKTCFAVAEVTYNVATASGCGIDLPFVSKHRQIIGVGGLYGASFPADQTGHAYMPGARDKVIVTAYTAGFRDAVAANTQRYSVCYEIQ